MSEVPLYLCLNRGDRKGDTGTAFGTVKGPRAQGRLSSDDVFQETSARYRAVVPEQWLQRHPEAGSSWPSWSKASHIFVSIGLTEKVTLSQLLRQ